MILDLWPNMPVSGRHPQTRTVPETIPEVLPLLEDLAPLQIPEHPSNKLLYNVTLPFAYVIRTLIEQPNYAKQVVKGYTSNAIYLIQMKCMW